MGLWNVGTRGHVPQLSFVSIILPSIIHRLIDLPSTVFRFRLFNAKVQNKFNGIWFAVYAKCQTDSAGRSVKLHETFDCDLTVRACDSHCSIDMFWKIK